MSLKSKGINAERELIHLFWGTGSWSACRIAGSGSSQFPSPDILAGSGDVKFAIEVKVCKGKYQYLDKDEISQLQTFSAIFGAAPMIAVKFNRVNWFFLTLDNLKDSGNNFVISQDLAKEKGVLFEELIKSPEEKDNR